MVERSAGLFFSDCNAGVPKFSRSHTFRSDPSGLVGRKPSGIPSAAIVQSQCFSQFQLSFPAESRWGPAPRCQVALSLCTPAAAQGRGSCPRSFSREPLDSQDSVEGEWCSFRWKLRLNGTAQIEIRGKLIERDGTSHHGLGFQWAQVLPLLEKPSVFRYRTRSQ